MRKGFLVFIALVNLVALPWIFFANRSRAVSVQSAAPREDFPDYGQMPAFTLVERSGKTVSDKDMRGSLWVVDFVFTECPNQCPMMTAKFALMQRTLPPEVRLASFSVDPERDTPERLKAYAEGHAESPERWLFLTGDKGQIRNILTALHLGNADDPNMHSLRFVFLDPDLRVRGYYNSEDGASLEQLKKDVKKWVERA